MPIDEITLLLALGSLNLLALGALALWIRSELENAVEELDSTLALAIKATLDKLMDGGIGGFEPVNPIQAAFASLIQSYATNQLGTIDATVISRNTDGTFQKSMDDFE
tara:strand:+ start:262 stop:585 length:324 start_codon:yes stop_codon:yes gene_type:complete